MPHSFPTRRSSDLLKLLAIASAAITPTPAMEASTERLWSTVFGTSFKLSGTAKRSALSTSLTLRRYAHGEGNLDYLFTAAARDRNHGSTPPRKFDSFQDRKSTRLNSSH